MEPMSLLARLIRSSTVIAWNKGLKHLARRLKETVHLIYHHYLAQIKQAVIAAAGKEHMKKIVYKCEICEKDVGKQLINRFNKRLYISRLFSGGEWKKRRFDICDDCLGEIQKRLSK